MDRDPGSGEPVSGPGRPLRLDVPMAVLLGGRIIQGAWLLLFLGAVYFNVVVLESELVTWFELRGELATATLELG